MLCTQKKAKQRWELCAGVTWAQNKTGDSRINPLNPDNENRLLLEWNENKNEYVSGYQW